MDLKRKPTNETKRALIFEKAHGSCFTFCSTGARSPTLIIIHLFDHTHPFKLKFNYCETRI